MINESVNKLIDNLIEKMKSEGIKDICVYLLNSRELDINIYEGDLDRYGLSDEKLIFIEGNCNGYLGYTYIENLDESLLYEYAQNIIDTAKNNNIKFNKKELIQNINNDRECKFKESDEIIKELKDIEQYTYRLNKLVSSVVECSYYHNVDRIILKNDQGIQMIDLSQYVYVEIGVSVKDGEKVQNNFSFRIYKNFHNIDLKEIAKEAVFEAIDKLTPTSIESGNYPVILRNDVVAEMISSYIPIFCGDVIEKDMSLLKGKLYGKIATEKLTIIESPQLECGKVCRTFDDEGTMTKEKYIIENGVLKNILNNNEIARINNTESTGNGFKKSYKESISVSPTNLYIKEGNKTLDDMISTINNGIMITDIQGLHAGINTVSGDFSLLSSGYYINNGKKGKAISEITVAGNIYQMLYDIEAIGEELKSTSRHSNFVIAPSLKISKLTITK